MSLYTLKVFGHSDDLVELEGDIANELAFYPDDDDKGMTLGLGDGTCLTVIYSEAGIWRITPVAIGPCTKMDKKEAVDSDEDDYSDTVTLTSTVPFKWAVLGEETA
jgi:hypothetical protein